MKTQRPMTHNEIYASLKRSPDWCECSEYPRAAHSHLDDGSHGAPFVNNHQITTEMLRIAGLLKGYEKDDSPRAKARYAELNDLRSLIGMQNFEAARKFYEYTKFWQA